MERGLLADGYAHIGVPRFQSAEIALAAMDADGIDLAVVCPFESCPDLREAHRAYVMAPHRFRIFGLALGAGRAQIEAGLHAQFDAGFEGMRLAVERVVDDPFILDVFAERRGIPLVVAGPHGLAPAAGLLVAFLNAHPDCAVISPHMAGPTTPDVFENDAAVRALFQHPRFYVAVSRQTLFEAQLGQAWTEALIRHVGWRRLMWGSEVPALYWRDENVADAASWIERFGPSDDELAGYRGKNLRRLLLGRPPRPPRPLNLPYEPFDFEVVRPAPMWPQGLSADGRLPAQLVEAWMARGGPAASTLGQFVSELLLRATDRQPPVG